MGVSISLLRTFLLLPNNTTKPLTSKQNNIPEPTPGEIHLPISSDASSVFYASVVYTLGGRLIEIKTIPEGFELITDIQTPNIPKFTVCTTCNQPTPIFGNFTNGFRQINYDMLKIGQNVRIVASYNLRTKDWVTNKVTIEDKITLPTNTPITPTKSVASSSAQ